VACHSRTAPRKPVGQGGRPKRPKTERTLLVEKADQLWRTIIKRPGECAACGRRPPEVVLEAAHGFSRIYDRTRWHLANGWCLCRGCHQRFGLRPEEWRDWMIRRYTVAFCETKGWTCVLALVEPWTSPDARAGGISRYEAMKRLAYSSETNPVRAPELKDIIARLEGA